MGATVLFVNAAKWFWNKKNISCVLEIFQRISHLILWKKAGLNRYVFEFYVDYNIIDASNIANIHKYLMKKHDIK